MPETELQNQKSAAGRTVASEDCSFKAEMKSDQLVRMVPYKGGDANHGHSCVKGRFAFRYATHKDRIKEPMIRDSINDPWQVVSWEEAVEFSAQKLIRAASTC